MKKVEFIKLYDQYAPRIYRYISLKLNSTHDSEDLTSEAFFRFWDKFGRKKKKVDYPQALLYQIAGNLVIDFYRKKARRTEVNMDPQDSVLRQIQGNVDLNRDVNLAGDLARVKTALGKIRPEYQDILIWRYLDDFSIKEMAQILEKSPGSVRILVHRALNSLKKEL